MQDRREDILGQIDRRCQNVEVVVARLEERVDATNDKLDEMARRMCPIGEIKPICDARFEKIEFAMAKKSELEPIAWAIRLILGALIIGVLGGIAGHVWGWPL